MTLDELELIDKRLERLEDGFSTLTTTIAHMSGQQQTILDKLNTPQTQGGLFQKLLLGSVVVNSLLHGVVTPEGAKAALTQLLQNSSGGTH